MSIKDKVKSWFSKTKAIQVRPSGTQSSLNGLYVANNKDLTTVINKVNEIENALNNLPNAPNIDLTDYAKKNEDNEFVTQHIKGDSAYIGFKKTNGDRKGYIGVASSTSNDISITAQTNSLILQANHNISLNVGNNYAATYDKAPTANNHIANKKYIDDRINAIPPVDLSNVAKVNEDNVFLNTTTNIFGYTQTNENAIFRKKAVYEDTNYLPVNDNEFANKKYVDSKVVTGQNIYYGKGESNYNMYKEDIPQLSTTAWKYTSTGNVDIYVPDKFNNKRCLVIINAYQLSNINSITFATCSETIKCEEITVSQGYFTTSTKLNYLATSDIHQGAAGSFTGKVYFNYIIVEVN